MSVQMLQILQTAAARKMPHPASQKFTREVFVELLCKSCRIAFSVMVATKYSSQLIATKRNQSG